MKLWASSRQRACFPAARRPCEAMMKGLKIWQSHSSAYRNGNPASWRRVYPYNPIHFLYHMQLSLRKQVNQSRPQGRKKNPKEIHNPHHKPCPCTFDLPFAYFPQIVSQPSVYLRIHRPKPLPGQPHRIQHRALEMPRLHTHILQQQVRIQRRMRPDMHALCAMFRKSIPLPIIKTVNLCFNVSAASIQK